MAWKIRASGCLAVVLCSIVLLVAGTALADSSRSFLMGLTPFKYSWIEDSQQTTYELVGRHADLIVHHLDGGVPWVEAFEGRPFSTTVEEELATRLEGIRPGQAVMVTATPIDFGRKALAGYWGEKENMTRPGVWKDKGFDDPDVIAAYLAYCRTLIRRFKPRYFAYGIEVNLLAYNDPRAYDAFVALARNVYPVLKREFPGTRILLSFYLEPPARLAEAKGHIERLLPYTDVFAISTYPYMMREGPFQRIDDIPPDWFEQVRLLAPGKPFAIAETGFIAEPMSAFWKTIESSELDQQRYARWMLSEAQRLDAEFVVWFLMADYDDLWTVLKWMVLFNPLMKAWKDTGLYDGELRARPALEVWDSWLRRPLRER